MTLYFNPTTSEVSLAGSSAQSMAIDGRLGADLPIKIILTDTAFQISAAWPEVSSHQTITANTLLSAGRNRRIGLGAAGVTANVDLPHQNNQAGDVLTLVADVVIASTLSIRRASVMSGSTPVAYFTLATLNASGQSFTFVSDGTATGWSLRAVDGAQTNQFQFIAKRPGDALGPAAVQTDFIQFGSALEWNGSLALRGPVLAEMVNGNNAVTLDAQMKLVLSDRILVSQMFPLNVTPTLFATGNGSDLALLPTPRTRLGADGSLQISPDGTNWSILSIDADGILATTRIR